jgi:very-short-patch-repair endonuclease/predicted transcriptional regulator of viral defense system
MALAQTIVQQMVRLSRSQNSALTLDQLRAVGLTRGAIRARGRSGRLIPVFRGVYLTADPELVPLARPTAAVLSLEPDAYLSARSAAAAWGFARPDPDVIDVTVVGRNPGRRAGVRIHRVKHLHAADVTTHNNIPITTPARTMIDFAAQATSSELADAFGDARANRLINDRKLKAALLRAPANHPGAAIVRAMLREGGTYDRSKAERIMRRLCRQAQLPQPLVNRLRHGFLVDFLWPDAELILEVDAVGTHGDRRSFEADRRRDQIHVAHGYVVIRVTWNQLQTEPLAVLARIAQALAHRAA